MKTIRMLVPLAFIAAAMAGCSSARDVEVTGEVKNAASGADPIVVEFYDIIGEGDDLERTSVHSVELAAPGPFAEKIPLEGDRVLVRAIADSNNDGLCTEGERWAELEVPIEEDAASVTLELTLSACPTADEE